MRNLGLLEEATDSLTMTSHPKKVVILGGGIAGMEAALDLKETGNTSIIKKVLLWVVNLLEQVLFQLKKILKMLLIK